MNNYNIEYINHILTTKIDKDGSVKKQDEFTSKRIKRRISNTKGMQMFKKNDYIEIQEKVVNSSLDLKIWNYLIKTYKKQGICRDRTNDVTITYIAKHFGITRQKVSMFIKRAIEANFIKKRNRTFLSLNPFVVVPYGISDKDLYELQKEWEEK